MTPNCSFLLLGEFGYEEALYAISKSYTKTEPFSYHWFKFTPGLNGMGMRAMALAHAGPGHNGFLKMIDTWWEIRVSRDAWQQFNTYHVGAVDVDDAPGVSESTMHTILSRHLSQDDFALPLQDGYLDYINLQIDYANTQTGQDKNNALLLVKKMLPEGFLQSRVLKLSYLALHNIVRQRENHKMYEWQQFVEEIHKQLSNPQFIFEPPK